MLVVGDAMLDRYLMGDVERVSPEAPVPVLRVRESRTEPGGAANVAAGVAALGAECRLVAGVGDDGEAGELAEALSRRGVDPGGLVQLGGRPTTVKTRAIGRGQQMLRLDREGRQPLDAGAGRRVLDRVRAALGGVDAVAVADYAKGLLSEAVVRALIREARGRGVPIVVDPGRGRFERYRGATVLKPNAAEAAHAVGAGVPSGEADLVGLRRRLEVEHLVVTVGSAGMRLVGPDGAVRSVPGEGVEVFDVSGAGDTVTAVMATALRWSPGVEAAARLANRAAALVVQKLGARPVGREELRSSLAGS